MFENHTPIEQFYGTYLDAFHTLDAAKLVPFYATPCVFTSGQGSLVLTGGDEIEQFFEQILRPLVARGYQHSEVRDLSISSLGEQFAHLKGLAIRYHRDGRELERTGAAYTLKRSAHTWQIVHALAYPL